MAFPIAAVLAGVSVLGGILGGKGRKSIDPEALKKLFGPEAVTADTVAFFNNMINSPEGAAMLNQASVIGADVSNRINARAAQSGMSGGGSESGIGQFAAAAGGSAADLAKGQVRGNMFAQALQAAMQNNVARMGLYGQSKLMEQGTPTMAQAVGAGLQSGAGMVAASLPTPEPDAKTDAPTSNLNSYLSSPMPSSGSAFARTTPDYSRMMSGPPAGMGDGAFSGSVLSRRKSGFRF
jgi:hypothetical protein